MSKLKIALDLIPEKIEGLVNDYREDLEAAWLKLGDEDDLTIHFAAKLSVEKGKNTCVVSMSSVIGKVKDKSTFVWDEKQGALPLEKDKQKGK